MDHTHTHPQAASTMRLTLLESDRSFLRSAELATLSIGMHVAVVGLVVVTATGTFRLPADERDARVLFLLPPDPAGAAEREAEIFLPGRPGSGLDEASRLPAEGQGLRLVGNARRVGRTGERSGARSEQPFGPAPFLSEKVYSALQVDQMVERYESSAAPVYPPELSARGTEGQVEAAYVVDTNGRVDTTTIRVMQSDHPRFTESVRTALGETRFRPAKRGGKAVRQLVQQRFRFKLAQLTSPLRP
jgi:TonB family protein